MSSPSSSSASRPRRLARPPPGVRRESRPRRGRRRRRRSSSPSSPPSFSSPSLVAFVGSGRGRLGSPSTRSRSRSSLPTQLRRRRPDRRARSRARRDRRPALLLDPVARPDRARRAPRPGGGSPVSRSRTSSDTAEASGTSSRLRARVKGSVAQPQLDQPGEIVAHARHGARAQRLAARLLGGVEHRARGFVGGRGAGVELRVVISELERGGVGEAARLGDLARLQRAPRHRRLDALARSRRRVAGKAQFDLGIRRDRPRRARERVAKGFEGIVGFGHVPSSSRRSPGSPFFPEDKEIPAFAGMTNESHAFPARLSGRSLPKTR